jgi:hypothetical protein
MAVEAVTDTSARADPFISEPADSGLYFKEMDYPAHIRTWNRFVHLLKWVVVHFICIGISLYFFLVASAHLMGVVMLAVAVAAIGYGIVTTGRIGPESGADPEDRLI